MVVDAVAIGVEEARAERVDFYVEVIKANTLLRVAVHRVVEVEPEEVLGSRYKDCLLYTSPSPRDATLSRMPSSA